MAPEQIMSEGITRAVGEATRIAIQTMAEAQAERMHDVSGPQDAWSHHEATNVQLECTR